jgi:hypothetical protein
MADLQELSRNNKQEPGMHADMLPRARFDSLSGRSDRAAPAHGIVKFLTLGQRARQTASVSESLTEAFPH